MPALRKANAYTRRKACPFTRWSRKKSRSYIKVVPPNKIAKFDCGDSKGNAHGKYPHVMTVYSEGNIQIRNNALESVRQFMNKKLALAFGENQFFLKVVPYPHHIQREHRMLTGAGADRMSTGMQLAFGKSMNKAVLLKKNAPIFIIALASESGMPIVRAELKKIKAKLPGAKRFVYTFVGDKEAKKKADEEAAENRK